MLAVENKNIAAALKQELLNKGIEETKIIHEVITCEFDVECDANILRNFWARRKGIEQVQDVFLEKNFYISDVPFYFQKDKKRTMINTKNRFCLTDSVNNTLDLTRVFF